MYNQGRETHPFWLSKMSRTKAPLRTVSRWKKPVPRRCPGSTTRNRPISQSSGPLRDIIQCRTDKNDDPQHNQAGRRREDGWERERESEFMDNYHDRSTWLERQVEKRTNRTRHQAVWCRVQATEATWTEFNYWSVITYWPILVVGSIIVPLTYLLFVNTKKQ